MMDSSTGNHKTEKGGTSTSSVPASGDMFGRVVNGTGETEGKRLAFLVEWLNSLLPDLGLPETASYEDLRSVLIDGTILCRLLNRLRPCSVDKVDFLVSPYKLYTSWIECLVSL
ncbi:putative calponin domain-containing protein [Rosa chinensis]|uniref:Putative calponin domain-containing protein n=1 Tax=Rosa chinensis TaxID=74649 RepID=A0A2P6PHE4_ROSCH|nr:putative calponin domain-containing protein [Rosa chinensis]